MSPNENLWGARGRLLSTERTFIQKLLGMSGLFFESLVGMRGFLPNIKLK